MKVSFLLSQVYQGLLGIVMAISYANDSPSAWREKVVGMARKGTWLGQGGLGPLHPLPDPVPEFQLLVMMNYNQDSRLKCPKMQALRLC